VCSDETMTKHTTALTGTDYHTLQQILLAEYGIDLRDYDRDVLARRIADYCQARGLASLAEVVASIGCDAAALRALGDVVYSHTTHFNRTPEHFDYLVDVARQARAARPGETFAVWSVGCSTGQEPYSIAIALLARGFEDRDDAPFRVVGSDCSPAALEAAAAARYRVEDVRRLAPLDYKRYFVETGSNVLEVAPAVRRHVSFGYLNLLTSDYGVEGAFDVVFLRNVLEFHGPAGITTILAKLRSALKSGGHLVQGEKPPMSASDERLCGYECMAPGCYRVVSDVCKDVEMASGR
jgi:chemotaxis protein methyltransferase CheR